MNVSVCYVGSSLLAPLKMAERGLNRDYKLDLHVAAHNFGSPLNDSEWQSVDDDLSNTDIVFVIHVMDGENAARLITALEERKQRHAAVIVINCMPDLMRRTRMGRLDVAGLVGKSSKGEESNEESETERKGIDALKLIASAGSWVGKQVKRGKAAGKSKHGHGQYLKWVDKLPGILKFVPSAGGLGDVKHYLNIFCYFLQPTPANIRSMVLYALKEYVVDDRLQAAAGESAAAGAYAFGGDLPSRRDGRYSNRLTAYEEWYLKRPKSKDQRPKIRSPQQPLIREHHWPLINATAGSQQNNEALRRTDSCYRSGGIKRHSCALYIDG